MSWKVRISTTAAAIFFATGIGVSNASTPAFEFGLQLAAQARATSTGLSFHTHYSDPADSSAQPPPLRKSVIQAPAGTVFDGRAVPACTASDDSLLLSGASACPQQSQVGTGTVIVITGCGAPVDPETLDVVLFNTGGGITELFSDRNTGVRITVGHAKFTTPSTITETPPPNPGCPPSGETTVRQVDFHFNDIRGADGMAFITTPGACPSSGLWTSHASATLANGHTYSATSATPCITPASRPRHRHHHRRRHKHHKHA
jgi:hypothetical protein